MSKTPRYRITKALRKLWLWSSERNEALRLANYSCEKCGVKQSKAKGMEQKIEVHHKEGILNWDELEDAVRKYLLPDVDKLECLCPDCHKEITFS